MLKNYFKIAWRNLMRNKIFSTINLLGLSLGIAVSLLILLFVVHELSYDTFHVKADRIFQAKGEMLYGDQTFNISVFSAAFATAVQDAAPTVEAMVRVKPMEHFLLTSNQGKSFYEDQVLITEPSFLSVFSFNLLSGNPQTALDAPNQMLLTPAMAKKYFGNENPIGKTLTYTAVPESRGAEPQKHTLKVAGIIEPAPSNSTLQYDFVLSFSSLATLDPNTYSYDKPGLGSIGTYFLLKKESAAASVGKIMNEILPASANGMEGELYLQNIQQLHLGEGSRQMIYIFLGIALVILLLALINYISLTTARSTMRAREVGVRKVVGAGRSQLAQQFFGESLLFLLLAFGLSLVLMRVLLPLFYTIIQVEIPLQFLWQPRFLWIAFAVLLVSGLIAGSYPALLLSRFIPTEVLKGRFSSGQDGALLRRIFIVFQFAVSVALIICSLVIQNQLHFIRNKDIGLNKEQVLVIPIPASIGGKYLSFKEDVKQTTGVQQVAASTAVPFYPQGTIVVFAESPDGQPVNLGMNNVEKEYLDLYQIRWADQLPEASAFGNLKDKVIINETAAKKLNLAEPVGSTITIANRNLEVLGVLKDFNYASLLSEIEPMVLNPFDDSEGTFGVLGGFLSIRLEKNTALPEILAQLSRHYRQFEAEKPFEYFFLDETFDKLYKYEDRLANIFQTFTFLAVFIAVLGLFGLATFTAERRTKEIGIRKVFGASVAAIVLLLSKDFLRLVLFSLLIGMPVAWYAMSHWLERFAYRIDLSWWMFVAAALLAVGIAFLTVSVQAIRAAWANPVKSLRIE